MKETNTIHKQRLNHWAIAREKHHSAVKEAFDRGDCLADISRHAGIPCYVVQSCLRDMGLTLAITTTRSAKMAKGLARGLKQRSKHLEAVHRAYDLGLPVLAISKAVGIGRATVDKCLADLGITKPTLSEGNRRSAAMLSPEYRKARAKPAHAAIRQLGERPHTRKIQSEREALSMRYVGRGEKEVLEHLSALGFDCIPQAARHGYNIDILVGSVAVEIHNKTSAPHLTTQTFCRTVNLLCAGLHVFYIRTGPSCPIISELAMKELVTFLDFASGNPSAPREYRVVRGDGQIDIKSSREFDHITAIVATYRRQ